MASDLMRRVVMSCELVSIVALALALGCAACGSDGAQPGELPGITEVESFEVEVTPEPPAKTWKEAPDAFLEGVTKVRGFECNDDWIFVDVQGNKSEGLYGMPVTGEPVFQDIYSGVGQLEALSSGVLVAQYGGANATASVVGVDGEGTATDMGFAFGDPLEIRALTYTGTHLVTFSKDWNTAEYMVHRGKLPEGPYEQVGPRLNETGMGLYATPDKIYVLTILNEVLGTACYEIGMTASADSPFAPCPSFPQFVASKEGEAYSINAQIYGSGLRMAAWFRVTEKGVKGARHFVASDQIKWKQVEGLPEVEPTAWHHDGEFLYVGLTNSGGKPAVYEAAWDGEGGATAIGEGLPSTTDKSGVTGLCRTGGWLYLVWLDYNAGGSTLRLMKRKQ
jgi:hypothetical protein